MSPVHAYENRRDPGPLEVELTSGQAELSVVVRDFGGGIHPSASCLRPRLRLGLTLIGALSSQFQLISTRDRGTEIKIQLSLQETVST